MAPSVCIGLYKVRGIEAGALCLLLSCGLFLNKILLDGNSTRWMKEQTQGSWAYVHTKRGERAAPLQPSGFLLPILCVKIQETEEINPFFF